MTARRFPDPSSVPARSWPGLAAVAVLLIAPAGPLAAAEFRLPSRIEAVTVFPDGASITRTIRVELPAGEHVLVLDDLPLTADPASIRIAGGGEGRLTVGSVDARQQRPFERPDPERVRMLETLRDQRLALEDRIAAERMRKRAAEALVQPATLSAGERGLNIAEARQALAAALEETVAADRAIREAERAQRAIDRDIQQIEAQLRTQPPRHLEARVDVEAGETFRGELTVTYAVRGARWSPLYDARLTTTGPKPSIELIRRAEIVQQTGEDWSDVALTVSTARVARGGSGPDLPSLIVRFEAPADGERAMAPPPPIAMAPSYGANQARQARRAPSAALVPVAEQEAVVDMGGFQASFRIAGRAAIGSGGGARALRIQSATIETDLVSRVVPSLDPTAYLEARFRHQGEVPLMPGRVNLYRDGMFSGRTQIAAATREQEVRLGFGADDLVRVEYQVVRRTDGTAGIISSAKTDEREFRIIVRNGAATPRKVMVEDRVPVTEASDITVETLSGMTAPARRDVRGRRGILEWDLEIAAGQSRDIRHGWRIRWPADRQIQSSQARG
ncbi:mucoidy inhibitor MuiA family protein [Phreatobacter sp.]|uniref:mucoidy inhibitor MuiA family protein n=1 Tax=Phreatobacter sp. TaxID=1966341 RepID=UPI003F709846